MLDMIELLGHASKDFQVSIVFTYILDFPLYDGLVRRILNRAGITNQVIFCDFGRYVQDIESQIAAFHSGRHYSVTPVYQTGAFHPKIYLLLGPRHGRALVGSGNATVGGLIRNAEVFGLFDFDADRDSGPHPMFAQCFNLATQLASDSSTAVRRQLHNAERIAPWLPMAPLEDGRHLLIGGPGREPLLKQIQRLLPTGTVDDVTVCSSSFDRRLRGLRILASSCKNTLKCIVQPDTAALDGTEVKRLGNLVEWHPFIDPYPSEKKKRRDARAHAKLMIFRHGSTQTCVFGSANASEPALSSRNTEAVVALPQLKSGEIEKRLGLQKSIRAKTISKELFNKTWISDEPTENQFSYRLTAAVSIDTSFRLSLIADRITTEAQLALSDRYRGTPQITVSLHQDEQGWFGQAAALEAPIRFAWIVNKRGIPLSNPVAITWPEVAMPRGKASLGSKASASVASMQDGLILGTVLFELLDQFKDFEVFRTGARGAGRSKGDDSEPEVVVEKATPEFFYTDQKPETAGAKHWSGDRIDLDILASLVQPLAPNSVAKRVEDIEEQYDDSRLEEEAERRQIDKKKGEASGDERVQTPALPTDAWDRAVSKLVRRLNRAASAIERAMEFREQLDAIPIAGIVRQIWMTHLAAFLAGRKTLTDDGTEIECLEPWYFADYVLRICRALTGSRRGGFLDKIPQSAWDSADGDIIKRGLAFLWTCAIWASAYMVYYYDELADENECPESIADAAPELVTSRFIAKVKKHCEGPDEIGLERRLPTWKEIESTELEDTRKRIDEIVALIESVEEAENFESLGGESSAETCLAGTLVFNPKLGVTILCDRGAAREFFLIDLSRHDNEPAKYAAKVAPILFRDRPYILNYTPSV
jgi:HKD family nuclease